MPSGILEGVGIALQATDLLNLILLKIYQHQQKNVGEPIELDEVGERLAEFNDRFQQLLDKKEAELTIGG
jgi:hypothetical protein